MLITNMQALLWANRHRNRQRDETSLSAGTLKLPESLESEIRLEYLFLFLIKLGTISVGHARLSLMISSELVLEPQLDQKEEVHT